MTEPGLWASIHLFHRMCTQALVQLDSAGDEEGYGP